MTAQHSFHGYQTEGFYDELFDEHGKPRPGAKVLHDFINSFQPGVLRERQEAIERALHRMGITFAVYGDDSGTEKIFPFDIVPRIVEAYQWNHIAAGLKQRIRALNLFIDDVYHKQAILKDGIIPTELVTGAESFRAQC
ncbi:MAG: circularly permuted type 2 ATP-grasp protein, partial [Planctomycetales bacterium]|nr:circularly permuted type 2 ATP-grasp protein [Planctomycetales bacterium]